MVNSEMIRMSNNNRSASMISASMISGNVSAANMQSVSNFYEVEPGVFYKLYQKAPYYTEEENTEETMILVPGGGATKSVAERDAKDLKSQGHFVKIVKYAPTGKYFVYYQSKRKVEMQRNMK
jgi:hypothetical protein